MVINRSRIRDNTEAFEMQWYHKAMKSRIWNMSPTKLCWSVSAKIQRCLVESHKLKYSVTYNVIHV